MVAADARPSAQPSAASPGSGLAALFEKHAARNGGSTEAERPARSGNCQRCGVLSEPGPLCSECGSPR